MGQTLTHGVYLPAEGERNCYDGLAGNWTILDGAVGTIADHTTALAGKAPAVHTHTKSDVTDLLNSNFIPSANNSYDLGSSSYQWNNVYSKGYYYNGTAWGLDQANTWSANNKFTGNVTIEKNSGSPTTISDSSLVLNGGSNYVFFRTKGSSNFKSYNSWLWAGYLGAGYAGEERFGHLKIYRASTVYGATGEETPDTSFSFIDVALQYKKVNITDNVSFKNDGTINACYPAYNNATDLGTSTAKWKSLNGINPGALSLPNTYTNIDTTNWDLTGTLFRYTPPIDGWLFVNILPNNNYAYAALEYASMRNNSESTTGKNAMACIAVRANTQVTITLSGASIAQARLVTCAGNV